MTFYVFKYGVGGHFWAAILDLNVKIVSECSKNLSIRSGLPKLVGKVASFAPLLAPVVQEISLLMVFNMARRPSWILKVKIIPKHNEYYSITSVMPKLVGNDTSYAPLVNLVQDISLFLDFNMASARRTFRKMSY